MLKEETSLGTTELKDLLKVSFLLCGDTFTTGRFLPLSPMLLLPLLLILLHATLLGTKQQAT